MRYWNPPLLFTTMLLASCAWSESSNWHLMDAGYSINQGDAAGDFLVEVHLNQLKELGGDVNSPQFRQFVAERLKRHGMCPSGWEPLPCVEDATCLQRTKRSVTVPGRCTS
jgi:hypothetical protein